MSPAMRLGDLLSGFADAGRHADTLVRDLSLDSRAISAGDAYVALRGGRAHGIAYAAAALQAGAAIVIAEVDPERSGASMDERIVRVDGLRAKLGAIAARFHGDASRRLRVSGVTGTNGKTSTVQLLGQALNHLGRRTATIGTLGAGFPGSIDAGERTTPDVISVQRLLARFLEQGATDVAMEVSSHALEQGRVDNLHFRLAVFTNLTRDHLDYHGSMEAYGAAKQRLFQHPGLTTAVVNLDDDFGRRLAASLPTAVECLGFAIDDSDADVRATNIETKALGLGFHLHTPWGEGRIESRLLGRFNVSNLLAVAASLGALGHSYAEIRSALGVLEPVNGRMNRLGGNPGQPLIVVDYAHTPDALEQALTSIRPHCVGALVCVFGCGGERDTGKRPQMAAIAERLADRVLVTDDNPRAEDGDAIVADIMQGFAEPTAVVVERDRSRAIHRAIAEARADDIVLVAGKGHEPYQEIAGHRLPFDDRDVARQALEARSC